MANTVSKDVAETSISVNVLALGGTVKVTSENVFQMIRSSEFMARALIRTEEGLRLLTSAKDDGKTAYAVAILRHESVRRLVRFNLGRRLVG